MGNRGRGGMAAVVRESGTEVGSLRCHMSASFSETPKDSKKPTNFLCSWVRKAREMFEEGFCTVGHLPIF